MFLLVSSIFPKNPTRIGIVKYRQDMRELIGPWIQTEDDPGGVAGHDDDDDVFDFMNAGELAQNPPVLPVPGAGDEVRQTWDADSDRTDPGVRMCWLIECADFDK